MNILEFVKKRDEIIAQIFEAEKGWEAALLNEGRFSETALNISRAAEKIWSDGYKKLGAHDFKAIFVKSSGKQSQCDSFRYLADQQMCHLYKNDGKIIEITYRLDLEKANAQKCLDTELILFYTKPSGGLFKMLPIPKTKKDFKEFEMWAAGFIERFYRETKIGETIIPYRRHWYANLFCGKNKKNVYAKLKFNAYDFVKATGGDFDIFGASLTKVIREWDVDYELITHSEPILK